MADAHYGEDHHQATDASVAEDNIHDGDKQGSDEFLIALALFTHGVKGPSDALGSPGIVHQLADDRTEGQGQEVAVDKAGQATCPSGQHLHEGHAGGKDNHQGGGAGGDDQLEAFERHENKDRNAQDDTQ